MAPPVLFNQYASSATNSAHLGFVSWALVNEAVLKRLMKGLLKLRFQDWQSGDNAVIMDVAAFTPAAGRHMLAEVKKSEFAKTHLWISRPSAAAGEPKLTEWNIPMAEPDTKQPALSGDELARANFERAVGEALLFLGSHPFYEQLFLEEIKERILPPMALKQFALPVIRTATRWVMYRGRLLMKKLTPA